MRTFAGIIVGATTATVITLRNSPRHSAGVRDLTPQAINPPRPLTFAGESCVPQDGLSAEQQVSAW